MKTFFTSDSHYGHAAILKYCNRPFSNVDEMNEALIDNWNKVVEPTDTVYHLGDFGFGKLNDLKKVFDRLKGNKFLVQGNHDSDSLKLPWAGKFVMKELKINDKMYQLCHFPQRSWDKSFHGARHLFGHCHGTLTPHGFSCDVGVDCWGYTPVSFEQLEVLFAGLPRDGWGKPMPRGKIWNGRDFPYSYQEFFIGDGSADDKIPDTYTD